MHKEIMVYTYNGILFSHINEGKPTFCDNMDELGGDCGKWNKLDTEGQILHDIPHIRNLKELHS